MRGVEHVGLLISSGSNERRLWEFGVSRRIDNALSHPGHWKDMMDGYIERRGSVSREQDWTLRAETHITCILRNQLGGGMHIVFLVSLRLDNL